MRVMDVLNFAEMNSSNKIYTTLNKILKVIFGSANCKAIFGYISPMLLMVGLATMYSSLTMCNLAVWTWECIPVWYMSIHRSSSIQAW